MYSVVIIGSGISGIDLATKCVKKGITNILVIDKNDKPGGVWAYHRSEITGFEWKTDTPGYHSLEETRLSFNDLFKHPSADEIFDSLNTLIKNNNISVKLKTNVEKCVWNENHWTLHTNSGELIETKWVIQCVGNLNNPRKIDLPDFYKNKPIRHSSEFNIKHLPKEKNNDVMIIGNSESAVFLASMLSQQQTCQNVYLSSRNKFNKFYIISPSITGISMNKWKQNLWWFLSGTPLSNITSYLFYKMFGFNLYHFIYILINDVMMRVVLYGMTSSTFVSICTKMFRPQIFNICKNSVNMDEFTSWRPTILTPEIYNNLKSKKIKTCDFSKDFVDVDFIISATGFNFKTVPMFVNNISFELTSQKQLWNLYEGMFSPHLPNCCYCVNHSAETDVQVHLKNLELIKILCCYLGAKYPCCVAKTYETPYEKVEKINENFIYVLSRENSEFAVGQFIRPKVELSKFLNIQQF